MTQGGKDPGHGPELWRLLGQLLETLNGQRTELLAGRRPESLHDFRVALRRTRALLGAFGHLLPTAEGAHLRKEFRWLGAQTGPARDLEVFQLRLAADLTDLAAATRSDLQPLLELLDARHRAADFQLQQVLESRRCQQLLDHWQTFLAAEPPAGAAAVPDRESAKELASRRIRKLYVRSLRQGKGLDVGSPAEAFHRLRITCKKLRYLLESLRPIPPRKPFEKLIQTLKGLQEVLGADHDCAFQAAALEELARNLPAGQATVATLLATGRLLERLERRRLATRELFLVRFALHTGVKNRSRIERLFPDKPSSSHRVPR
ncbi:hypothetical protein JCM30471_21180 [Desulfuromonas carbonis]|uniref:CHAD domain-containing protein n=1 Tax=Desulfuromonas sp. DDH964 TaxID=1823759 RepID=UPI00078B7B07|nr:CHAD domain-containing protein [Desulfuromonas sp. DDH964]AMV73699.1 CHAD domain-containing protein [Desulfuromonas sp. DDH964]